MKHKSNIYLTLTCVTLACISLAGCVKELGLTRFGIAVEQYGGGGKLVVTTNDVVTSAFVAGDTIRINGQKGVVAGDADGLSVTFSEAVTPVNDKYHALYPASLFTSQGADGSIAVDLPSEYNYEEDGSGNQLIDIPLAAVSKNNQLLFRHLTGALVFLVSPVANENIVLDYIMVESSGTPLWGTGTVTFVGDDTLTLSLANDPDKRHVTMFFPTAAYATINQGSAAPKRILIPVPAVPESNRFTITVCAHSTSSAYSYYIFHQQQDEQHAGALLRHEVGFVPINNLTSQRFVGSGTADDPYIISNRMDYRRFLKLTELSSICTTYFKMDHNIDFHGDTIKTGRYDFQGHFDGDGHSISNARVTSWNDNSYAYLSLFPKIVNGSVSNLTISDLTLNLSSTKNIMYIGGLSYQAYPAASTVNITNITTQNITILNDFISRTSIYYGGIIGYGRNYLSNPHSFTINRCNHGLFNQYNIEISNTNTNFHNGGILGYFYEGNIDISNCNVNCSELSFTDRNNSYSTRDVNLGSIIGTINSGTVSLSNTTAQGLIGYTGTSTNIKKICGNAAANSITTTNVNMDNLTVQRRNNSSSTWTTITDLY